MPIFKIINKLKNIFEEFCILLVPIGRKHHLQIPYFSQWENKKEVENIILKRKGAKDDLFWKSSGAKSKDEYELWSWNVCGMACLKMVMGKINNQTYQTIDLGKRALSHGAYKLNNKNIDGLFYEPFCSFVKKEFKLQVSYLSLMSLTRIFHEINKDNFVIASVSPLIRYAHETKESEKIIPGGHLVVITGYDKNKEKIYLHNPSGFYQKSQENFEISFKEFKKYFAYRGIVLKK